MKEKRALRGEKLTGGALELINGERQGQYGNPEDSFADIAVAWTIFLQRRYNTTLFVAPSDVAAMMALLKLMRECHQHKRDNLLDAVGYLGLMDDMMGAR